LLVIALPSRCLITSCRTVLAWWFAGGELSCGVVGFPALPLADGL
jgi:hypothetical protein